MAGSGNAIYLRGLDRVVKNSALYHWTHVSVGLCLNPVHGNMEDALKACPHMTSDDERNKKSLHISVQAISIET